MYDATDFYLNTRSIRTSAGREFALKTLQRVIADRSIARAVTERICSHARNVEQTLAERLTQLAVT
jgi:hypothetical protein